MTLIQFKGGDTGYDSYICPDSVVSVSATQTEDRVNIYTLDARTFVVQGTIEDIVKTLTTTV